jgi:surface polysaccharide O-acyltransferase-like enzyme
MEVMELLALFALAGALSFVFTFVQSHIGSLIPQNKYLSTPVAQHVITGLLILLSFVAASYTVRALHLSKHLPKGVK